jgi:hypothetical protein
VSSAPRSPLSLSSARLYPYSLRLGLWVSAMWWLSSRRPGRRDKRHKSQTSFGQAFLAEHKHCGAKLWRRRAKMADGLVYVEHTVLGVQEGVGGLKKCADGRRRTARSGWMEP